MFLHISLLLALVGPLGSRLGARPNLLPTTTGARRRGVSAALQVAMSGIGSARSSTNQKLPMRPASMSAILTKEDPTPTVELYADGTVNQYTSTLTSLRANYKLSTRDVRLLRSSTRVLAPREEYVIFDLGDLKGVLQRDRVTLASNPGPGPSPSPTPSPSPSPIPTPIPHQVILIGADRPAATALADELRQRLVVERDDRELERDTPFEVRVVECLSLTLTSHPHPHPHLSPSPSPQPSPSPGARHRVHARADLLAPRGGAAKARDHGDTHPKPDP